MDGFAHPFHQKQKPKKPSMEEIRSVEHELNSPPRKRMYHKTAKSLYKKRSFKIQRHWGG